MDEPDEQRLVDAARGGSHEAVERLFTRHWTPAWRAAYAVLGDRAAADDVAQDAFLRAFAHLDGFDGRRSFGVWLHRIVVNGAIDALRTRERRAELTRALPMPAPDVEAASGAVLEALRLLPADRRAAVVVHHVLGFSLAETADILNVPVGTVQSRCGRGVAQLRRLLEVTT